MATTDMVRKRSILLSARLRFSPATQPVRDTTVDKVLEQNLLIADSESGLTIREIERQRAISFADGVPAFARAQIEASLRRLEASGRVMKLGRDQRYRLTEAARSELWDWQEAAEKRFSRVISRLFADAPHDPSTYATPFLELMCIIFSGLGQAYVRIVKGDASPQDLIHLPLVSRALREIKAKYPAVDGHFLETGMTSFFRDADPDYDAVKWNFAQNYYIAKCLGLDPGGSLLSKEVFGGATFYLDTNVLIPALEPSARHHDSFKTLSNACRKLGIEFHVCRPSLDELRGVVQFHRSLIEKVASRIPDATANKVRDIFYDMYRETAARTKGEVDLDQLFSAFADPMAVLSVSFGVTEVDDRWFVEAERHQDTERFTERIRREYQVRRGREKGKATALHDALLLLWVQRQREQTRKNVWVVTLDTSLPVLRVDVRGELGRPVAITLDALLQWITPVAVEADEEDGVARIFAEAVKYQLLPQENLFDLRDFLVFAEMEWSTKELPAEDVEACIRYLKTHAGNLDPSDSADREKIAHEIGRFFADPGRKYKEEVSRLEAQIATLEGERDESAAEGVRALKEMREQLTRLQQENQDQERERQDEKIRRAAYLRVASSVVLLIAIEAVVVTILAFYGSGDNLLQKVLAGWPMIVGGLAVASISSFFIIGKERIQLLGWPFLKASNSE